MNENTVGIGIYARTNESTVTLSNNIREKIEEVSRTLPDGLKLSVSFDRATYIKEAIQMCYQSIILALALVVGIDMPRFKNQSFLFEFLRTFVSKIVNPNTFEQTANRL